MSRNMLTKAISYKNVHVAVAKAGNKTRAKNVARFFKTGPGQYGEGDIFVGLTVPMSRVIAKEYRDIPLPEIKKLLASKIHEERLIALLILTSRFSSSSPAQQKSIVDLYLNNTKNINNWDLVDLSASQIVGNYLQGKSIALLKKLALSSNLWERRIAIVSTFAFIRKGEYTATLTIATLLLNDTHDLIHKAVGWMLREVGKRASKEALLGFLNDHAKTMHRTMLRYAIEHFNPKERLLYMHMK